MFCIARNAIYYEKEMKLLSHDAILNLIRLDSSIIFLEEIIDCIYLNGW